LSNYLLLGKIFVEGSIKVVTGLHIGGSKETLEIGAVDSPVIKTPTGVPFIPGSSLKGKMRGLLDQKYFDLTPLLEYRNAEFSLKDDEKKQRKSDLRDNSNWWDIGESFIHICNSDECEQCRLFGRPSELPSSRPTLLYCRDAFLNEDEFKKTFPALEKDGLWTEVKWENAIDRLTSAANPRQIERVPPGALFTFGFVFRVFQLEHINLLNRLLEGMKLLEDNFLGGMGTRGSGQIQFTNLTVTIKSAEDYKNLRAGTPITPELLPDLCTVLRKSGEWVQTNIPARLNGQGGE
jgi:CRISPR-associated protein Csm3